MDVPMKKTISLYFNIVATLALTLVEWINALITYDLNAEPQRTLISRLFKPLYLQVSVHLLLVVVMALICAAVFKHIWNCFITDIAKLRDINLNEAYALSFIFVWCTAG